MNSEVDDIKDQYELRRYAKGLERAYTNICEVNASLRRIVFLLAFSIGIIGVLK